MYTFIIVLIIIASILLIGAVLIQKSKGGGLASGFASGNQMMGVRKTTDFIEKATWSLIAFIIVLSIISTYVKPQAQQGPQVINVPAAQETQATPFQTTDETSSAAPAQEAPAATPAAPAADDAK